MSRGHHQPRSRFGRPTIGKCRRGKAVLIDVIDVDNLESSSSVPVGVPGTLNERRNCSRKHKLNRQVHRGAHVSSYVGEDGGDLDSDASSSKKIHSRLDQSNDVIELDEDDCQILEESSSSFRFSKCDGFSHGGGSGKNHYGLHGDSDNVLSESESSDCEVIEDPSGKFREDWEKAAFRRKKSEYQGSGSDPNCCSASSCNKDFFTHTCQGSLHSDTSAQSSSREQVEEQADFWRTANGNLDTSGIDNVFRKERASHDRVNKVDEETSSAFVESFSFSNPPHSYSSNLQFPLQNKEQNTVWNEAYSFYSGNESAHPVQTRASPNDVQSVGKDTTEHECGVQINGKGKASAETLNDRKNNHVSAGDDGNGILFQHGVEVVNPGKLSVNAGYIFSEKGHPACEGLVTVQNIVFEGKEKVDNKLDNLSEHFRKCSTNQQAYLLSSGENCDGTVSLGQAFDPNNGCFKQPLATNGNAGLAQDYLIIMREKHKETEEYKRAEEEEWASRQRQLQLQAEEVQRLRRRKKAETLRLIDMERRQKQRVEEIRETQKKDKETINLKEDLRIKCRKELELLEVRSMDMASLLRALGISVGGGLYPLPSEVNAAYKKALLKFHPDRATRLDIQRQVEAEEKFKLITRLKEKFLPAA